jgi:CO dehydrogenase maturation factor
MLGFGGPSRPIMELRQRFPSGETKPGADWVKQRGISFLDIPGEYLLARDNLRLLSTGKIVEPFQGCACSMAELAGDLARKLVLKDKEIVLMDTEAGIESFGRGVERGADTVLIAVEPSSESLALAEKIFYMADGLGIKQVRVILNKVPSEKVEGRVLEEVARKKLKVIGSLYLDSQISDASLEGNVPPSDSSAQKAMKEIATRLLNES